MARLDYLEGRLMNQIRFGAVVKVKGEKNAQRPGLIGSVVAITIIDNKKQMAFYGADIGDIVYTIEFSDGSEGYFSGDSLDCLID